MEESKKFCPSCMAAAGPEDRSCRRCGKPLTVENQTTQLPVGTVLADRYQIGRCIGSGGFGITYIGRDLKLDMVVAVKEYYLSGMTNRCSTQSLTVTAETQDLSEDFEKQKKRFTEEARTLAKFANEPHIVCVRDFFEENNTAYIVMEYLQGRSLKQVLEEDGPMSFDQAAQLLLPVMEALDRVHRSGLIHRDISPSNLMLTTAGGVKLLDFGTARAFDFNDERSRSIVLKPGFAPEEQYRSRSDQGPWTDVYAFCATIYKMITGVTPENSMNRVFQDTLQRPSACGARISPAQEQVLLKGMAVRGKDRYQSMAALRSAVVEAQNQPRPQLPEEDDDERTLYRPAPKQVQPVRQPEEQPAPRPTPVRPEPRPEPVRAEPRPAPRQSEEKPAEQKPPRRPKHRSHPEEPPKKKGKAITFLIAAAVVLAIFLIVPLLFTNPYVNADAPYAASFQSETVTPSMIRTINRDSNVTHLTISGCDISDEAIEKLADNKHLKDISISGGRGFTSLDPLAEIETLEELDISFRYDPEDNELPPPEALFTRPFPTLQDLRVSHSWGTDGGAYLSNFAGLKYLGLYDMHAPLDLNSLAPIVNLDTLSVSRSPVLNSDYTPMAGKTTLRQIRMEELDLTSVAWMRDMPLLKSLWLNDNQLTSLDGLQDHVNLMWVEVNNNQIRDLSGLSGCTELYSLDANNNQIQDISGLKDCSRLNTLTLAGNQVLDISALENCPALRDLDLNESQVSDITALSGCPGLLSLNLRENPISDASALSACTELKYLNLSGTELTDLDFCEPLIHLVSMRASRCKLQDISGLKNTTQLEKLWLNDNQISDISWIASNAPHLESVHLANNRIVDIQALQGAGNLHSLSMGGNEIRSLEPLAASPKLRFLLADNNQISDITPLGGAMQLVCLDLAGNQITDASALTSMMSGLRAVMLQHNQITSLDFLGEEAKLKLLAVYDNPIADFTGIERIQSVNTSWDQFIFSYAEGMSIDPISQSKYAQLFGVDTPLDRQAEMDRRNAEIKKENGTHYPNKITFCTSQQADEKMKGYRTEALSGAGAVESAVDLDQYLNREG